MKKLQIVLREWKRSPKGIAYTILGFLSGVANQLFWAAVIVLLPQVFDNLDNLEQNLYKITLYVVGLIVSSALASMTVQGRHEVSGASLTSFVKHVQHADYDMFTKLSCPSIIHASDTVWKVSLIGRMMADAASQITGIIIKIYSIWLIFPGMTVPVIGIYLACFCGLALLYRVFAKLDSARDNFVKSRTVELNETVHGFAEVRTFGTEGYHEKSIAEKQDHVTVLIRKKIKYRMALNGLFCLCDGIATVTAILILAKGILFGIVSPASAIAVISIIWELTIPIDMLVEILDNISDQLSSVEKFAEVVEYQNQTSAGEIKLSGFHDAIRIKDLSFQYRDSESVLRDVEMIIPKGSKIGICGSSGGGKSTLFKLLAKYYDPSKGSIEIDGINYRKLDTKSLRRFIGVVHQENHIFEGTIYENVVYGNWNGSEYDVIEACKKANLYDFIQSLPDKFQTQVGPNGLKLSGGQKQRIALARVFLSNAPIILLDEATSALDNESESLVQEALSQLGDRTVITIAHRLSTIKDSDRIYVVDNGTIAESGTHEELLNRKGIYASLQK